MKLSAIAALLLLVLCCSLQPRYARQQRLLYIGNSLTYYNNLPQLVKEIAAQDGVQIVDTAFLFPDYSLEDHWNAGNAAAAIRKGGYDFVILQQGPSALKESQALLLDFSRRFVQLCKEHKTRPALYMVWPSQARAFDFDNVIYSYTNAAKESGAGLCAAGLAWKYAWQADSTLALYSADRFHPSLAGSVLAAMVIYGSINKKTSFDFLQYDHCSWRNELSRDKMELLKRAAEKAISN